MNNTRSSTVAGRAWAVPLLLALGLGAARAAAQPLPAACSNGGPNYTPFGLTRFSVGDTGTPLLRVTLGGSARCNDGTPAVMYIRTPDANYNGWAIPPAQQKHERWVIFFDGGGGCGDADECLERWCGLTGFDRAGKMSTLGAYDAITGAQGIFRRDPAVNTFAGYNQVLLNYCSSDNYIGAISRTGVTPTAGPTYDIEFNGDAIVREVFGRLLAGVGPDAGPAATFWNDTLPSLLTAEEIVIAGESAGGGGVRHHLDSLRDWLRASGLPAQARVYGVIDAGSPPAMWHPGMNWGAVAGAPASYADYLVNFSTPRVAFWGAPASAIDQSCLDPAYAAAHAGVGGVHPDICYDTTYTLFNHITTPVFVREDINDTLHRDKYINWQLVPSLQAYWSAVYNQLVDLSTWTGGLEPLPVVPGVFGPKCNQHVSALTNGFFTHAVTLPGGAVGSSFHDLIVNWATPAAPSSQIQVDGNPGPAYTSSFCP